MSKFRIQNALSQFIRSIQSFDSKYDDGRLTANNDQQPFSNFTAQENRVSNYLCSLPILIIKGLELTVV
ncbi:hypothetical protein [Lacinutrix neustonica]|uniref:hypothetical protein n=1 Tax=Lacinutrix neustonica TaxID=2980107 RepID=UPI0036F1B60F